MKKILGLCRLLKLSVKPVVFVLFSALLVSCGSGSSGSPDSVSEPSSAVEASTVLEHPYLQEADERLGMTWGRYGAFADDVEAVADAYSGLEVEAEISTETIGPMLNAAMMGIPAGSIDSSDYNRSRVESFIGVVSDILVLPKQYFYSALNDSRNVTIFDRACNHDGAFDIYAVKTPLETDNDLYGYSWQKASLVVEFKDCTGERGVLNGLIKITIDNTPDLPVATTYSMEGLEVVLGETRLVATGVISEIEDCEDHPTIRADLVLSEKNADKETWYQNFEWKTQDEFGSICGIENNYPWNKFSGSLYLSDMGLINVSTDGSFPFKISHHNYFAHLSRDNIEDEQFLRQLEGTVSFSGIAGGKMDLNYRVSAVYGSSTLGEAPHIEASLTPSNSVEVQSFSTTFNSIKRGIWSDFGDSDFDGLPNSWETYHDLDPHYANDALEEGRYSGITPLEAYARNVEPEDGVTSYAPSTDVGINVEFAKQVEPDSGKTSLSAVVSGFTLERYYTPLIKQFDVVLTGDADWKYQAVPDYCRATDEPKTLRCNYEFNFADSSIMSFLGITLPIAADRAGEVGVSATLNTLALDRDLSNNTDSKSTQYDDVAPVDIALTAPEYAIGNTVDTRTIYADIMQEQVSGKVAIEATVEVSSGLRIVEAELTSSGSQALISRCTIGVSVVCNMDDVVSDDRLQLELSYRLIQHSDQSIEWSVSTDNTELSLENNTQTTHVSAANSATELQQLIDSAEPGTVVELPPGRYIGTLNLWSQDVVLRGSTGAEPTILESAFPNEPIFLRPSRYFKIEHMTLRTSGGLIIDGGNENVTISDSVIEPSLNGNHQVDGLFDSTSYRIVRSKIQGFGAGEGNSCASLFHQPYADGFYEISVYLDQNLILNNNCDQLILVDDSGFVLHYLNNNTIVNNPTLVRFKHPAGGQTLSFINNIIVGADTLLDINGSAFTGNVSPGAGLYSSRNLIWQSERPSFLTSDLLARTAVEIGKLDFNMDPQFVDPDNVDYRVSVSSPVIDRGDEPAKYAYTWNDGAYENDTPAEDEQIKAIDGLLDGIINFDLGAFEFDPLNQ